MITLTQNQYLVLVYSAFFVGCVILSFLINRLFLRFLFTLGIRSHDKIIRWGSSSKPSVGGFSFFIIFLLSVACYSIFFDVNKVFLNKEFFGLLVACILGFFFYNWHPAVIYMGDTGSQFLGVFLSAVGIKFFWQAGTVPPSELIDFRQVIIPILVFIVPIVDTTTVFINRILRKQSPFVGGKDHTTHSLAYIGFSDRQVALTFIGISLFSILLVLCIEKLIPVLTAVHTFIFTAYLFIVLGILFSITFFKTKSG